MFAVALLFLTSKSEGGKNDYSIDWHEDKWVSS